MSEFTVVLHGLNIGESSQPRRRERERRRPAEVLPASLPPLGLSLDEVAAFIGVSPNKYLDLVRRRLMPQPRMVDGRRSMTGNWRTPPSSTCQQLTVAEHR